MLNRATKCIAAVKQLILIAPTAISVAYTGIHRRVLLLSFATRAVASSALKAI
jgi:hypothetical protein